MKELLQSNKVLKILSAFVKENTVKLAVTQPVPSLTAAKATIAANEGEEEKRQRAAKIIQRRWRGYKVKEAIVASPYFSYLSLIDQKDEQRLLSAIMFGRHEAELKRGSQDRSENPFINDSAAYHRGDRPEGPLFQMLLKQFGVNPEELEKNYIFPIIPLRTISLEDVLIKNPDREQVNITKKEHDAVVSEEDLEKNPNRGRVNLVKNKDCSIALLVVPKDCPDLKKIRYRIVTGGLTATPWEMATNVKQVDIDYSKTERDIKGVSLNPGLPDSKEKLLGSEIVGKLSKIAKNKSYTTQKLALCLLKMLDKLPDLGPQSIQRIALMLEMTNTFYVHNYPRYAFCVYAIIHEISLGLFSKKDEGFLKESFDSFVDESKLTFCKSFGLTEATLAHSTFIASPAMSGTNAFAIAMKIANKMQTSTGKRPSVSMFEPCYYEFSNIQKSYSDADIFIFSTGPIVNPEGLTPGMDINRFVKRHIIDKKRTTPATLIIDATTTLYKNLQLNEEVKALIEIGQLSILVIESHQKFGLLHTDQAQHGRLFGLCSKASYAADFIQETENNARLDFNEHIDMRIGAFISTHCSETLEEIKEQHFTNGALLRNLLVQTTLASRAVVKHPEMLTNLNELYFVNSPEIGLRKAVQGIIEPRNSFGHYATTSADVLEQTRISPNATDDIDCLIQAAQVYVANYYKPEQLFGILFQNANKKESLSLDEQIIFLAMANNLLFARETLRSRDTLQLYLILNSVINQCNLLKGRVNFSNILSSLFDLQKKIIEKESVVDNKNFFAAINSLYRHKIQISDFFFSHIKANSKLTNAITLLDSLAINSQWIEDLINHPKKLKLILEHTNELQDCLVLIRELEASKVTINLDTLIVLLTSPDSKKALDILSRSSFPFAQRNVQALIKTEAAQFILGQESTLSEKKIETLAALSEVLPSCQDSLPLLNKEDFCKAILMVFKANNEILFNLKKAPEKYEMAQKNSPIYLKSCFDALGKFYNILDPAPGDKKQLISALNKAKNKFCRDAIGKDRSIFSKASRLALMGVVNFFSGLTFGLAHYAHYKATNRVGFFTQTNSKNKLDEAYRELHKILIP